MGTGKPLVSLKILTYNHSEFALDMLEGAVSQTYSPLEIVISDDCSSDDTYNIIEDFVNKYNGPHIFKINRNNTNLGIAANLEYATSLCSGELIVNQGGDDISLPNRVEHIVDLWIASGRKTKGFFSNALTIDKFGNNLGLYFQNEIEFISSLEEFESSRFNFSHIFKPYVWMLGATSAFHRSIYTDFLPINSNVKQEDGVLSFRSLLLGGLSYINEPLVKYRRHDAAISNPNNFNGRIKLLRNEYYYFKNQLDDAKFLGSTEIVQRKIKFYCRLAYLKRIIFGIPIIGEMILKSLVYLSHKIR